MDVFCSSFHRRVWSGPNSHVPDVQAQWGARNWSSPTNVSRSGTSGGEAATCSLYTWRDEYLDMLVRPLEPWDQLAFEENDLDDFVTSLRSGVSAMQSWGDDQ